MPDIVCGRLLLGCFCVGAGRTGVVSCAELAFLVAMVIMGLCSVLELAGYLLVPHSAHRQPPPLDSLLLLVLPACSLCWLTRGGGAGYSFPVSLRRALGPGDVSLPWR